MNKQDKQAAVFSSKVVRAARKKNQLSQADVSRAIGISQSALSKIENATMIFNARQWFDFCTLTKINHSSFLTGYIDSKSPIVINSDNYEGGYKLPERYSLAKATKARTVRAFLIYFLKAYGEKTVNDYCRHVKVDPDFFTDLDNQINLQFSYDLLAAMSERGCLTEDTLQSISTVYSKRIFHGELGSLYKSELSQQAKLNLFVQKMNFYETNFQYTLSECAPNKIVISAAPFEHIHGFRLEDSAKHAICVYKTHALNSFLSMDTLNLMPYSITETECSYRGASRCLYVAKNR